MVSLLSGEVTGSHFARLTSWQLGAEVGWFPVMTVVWWPSQSEAALVQAGVPCTRGSDWCGVCPWKLSLKFFSSPKIMSPQYLSQFGWSRVDLCSLLLKTKNPSVKFIYVKFLIPRSQHFYVLLKKESPGRFFTILHGMLSTLPTAIFQTFYVSFPSVSMYKW